MPPQTAAGTRKKCRIGFRKAYTAAFRASVSSRISPKAWAMALRSEASSPRPR